MSRYKLVAFEPISENEIANYTFDGVENQEKPLNPNEEFIQLTSKIDFKKLNGKTLDYTSADLQYMDEESEPLESIQLNVTEGLKKHILLALNEVNALIDILQVTKDNHYMQLKKVVKETHEDNVVSYVAAKKMGLAASASTLLSSTMRLSKTLSSVRDQTQQNSFYTDLAALRREWRVKWFQKHLVGDLSLSSCGSLFPEHGGFQILEEEDDCETIAVGAPLTRSSNKPDGEFQNLKIVLMHNQEGEPLLRMRINQHSKNGSREFNSFHELPEASECKLQLDKLNRAQILLFLQEIFSTMCWESGSLNCPVVVKENRLIINIFGQTNLEIDFLILPEKHWFGYNDKVTQQLLDLRSENRQILDEYDLFSDAMIVFVRDLLREKHRLNMHAHFSLMSPIAGPVQIPTTHRHRGTQLYRPLDHRPSDQGSYIVFLLPTLLSAVQFYRSRKELLELLDNVAENLRNSGSVYLRTHIHSNQSVLRCSLSLLIGCTSYSTFQYSMTLHMSVQGRVTTLIIVSDRLRHQIVYESIDVELMTSFFRSQIWNYKIDIINKLGTVKHRWHLVDVRMTNCRKSLRDETDVGVGTILLSNNGCWLLKIVGKNCSENYSLSMSHSRVEDQSPVEWRPINLLQFQQKLMKSDLETIDTIFTALY